MLWAEREMGTGDNRRLSTSELLLQFAIFLKLLYLNIFID